MKKIIKCAYCKGTGKDFYYPSEGCRVCSKTGQVEVEEPAVTCAYCSGTGKNPLGVRSPCPVCRGKGSNTWNSDTVCTRCKGAGKSSDGYPCTLCKGKTKSNKGLGNTSSDIVKKDIKKLSCAYCKGTGKDFYYPSEGCRVCSKTGQVEVEEPAVVCAYCSGTGKNPLGVRSTCPVCRGKGSNTWNSDTVCTRCKGTGKSIDGYPCTLCKGKTKSNKGFGGSSGYGYELGY